ncbi:MAG: hypothetical protein LBK95_13150 [Bifidobacteriaceae bacterium]|jgi:hypothetical protein|nr:hypothetical protein [Bifidobacteriaceae bacterium]
MTEATPAPDFGTLAPKRSKGRFGAAAALTVVALAAAWLSPGLAAPSVASKDGASASAIHPGRRFIETETVIQQPAWPGATLVSVVGSGCFEFGADDLSGLALDPSGRSGHSEVRYFCEAEVVGARVALEAETGSDFPDLVAAEDPALLKEIINQRVPIEGTVFGADSALPRRLGSDGSATLHLLWEVDPEAPERVYRQDWTQDEAGSWTTSGYMPDAETEPVIVVTLRSVLGGTRSEHLTMVGTSLP